MNVTAYKIEYSGQRHLTEFTVKAIKTVNIGSTGLFVMEFQRKAILSYTTYIILTTCI